jgi:hypothetical protein
MSYKIQDTTIINNETDYIDLAGTTAVKVPVGTEAERPTGVAGQLRFNSDTDALEVYNGTAWVPIGLVYSNVATFTASGTWNVPAGVTRFIAVVIGGGGGGGGGNDGNNDVAGINPNLDGGFGGYGGINITELLVNGATATITVGAGGAGTNASFGDGSSGGTSSLVHNGFTVSATGGAGGNGATSTVTGVDGASGTASGSFVYGGDVFSIIELTASALASTGILGITLTNDVISARSDATTRPRGASSTAAVTWTSGSSVAPGARGSGESSVNANDASGGYTGAVFIIYN